MRLPTDLKVIKRTDLNPNAFVYQIRGGMIHYGTKLPQVEVCTFNPYINDCKEVAEHFAHAVFFHSALVDKLKELAKECKTSAPQKSQEATDLLLQVMTYAVDVPNEAKNEL